MLEFSDNDFKVPSVTMLHQAKWPLLKQLKNRNSQLADKNYFKMEILVLKNTTSKILKIY